MESKQKIHLGSSEIIWALLSVIIVKIVIAYTQNTTGVAGTASWIMMIFITIIALLVFYGFIALMKNFERMDIIDISKKHLGKGIAQFYGVLVCIYFIIRGSMLIRQVGDRIKFVSFKETPISFVMIFFLLAAVIATYAGINVIINSSKIIVPIIVLMLIVIIVINIKTDGFVYLYPILGNGVKSIFVDSIPFVYLFSSMIFFLFLTPYVKNTASLKKTGTKLILIGGVFFTATTALLLTLFPYSSSKNLLMPIYLIGGIVSVGEKLQKLEAIFLVFWTLAFMLVLSLVMVFTVNILKKTFGFPDHKPFILPVACIIFFLAILPFRFVEVNHLEELLERYSAPVVFGLPYIILISANISRKIKKKKVA